MRQNEQSDSFDLYSVSTRGGNRKKRRIKHVVNVVASIVLTVSILLTVLMGGYLSLSGFKLGGLSANEDESGKFDPLTVSSNSGVSYILVLGVDPKGLLTDIIAVACMDHEKNTVNFLQIPRDTFAGDDVPTCKINAVYGNPRKGEARINALRRRISSLFGIPLDHYVLFTIKGFINVIDALGGVTINIEQKNGIEIMDPETLVWERIGPGWVTLTGHQATGFVRKRTGISDGYLKGDIQRIEAQRLVYVALAKKLKSMSLSQMFSVANKCYKEVSTDMSINTILGYATEVRAVNMDQMGIYALPGQNASRNRLSMWSPHKAEYVELFNQHFNPYNAPITEDDIKLTEIHTTYQPSGVEQGGSLAEIEQNKNQVKTN